MMRRPRAGRGGECRVELHFQSTGVWQGYPGFHSPFSGPNSLPGGGEARETLSGTAFLGRRLLWPRPDRGRGRVPQRERRRRPASTRPIAWSSRCR
jgi:hypothetical protein